MCQAYGFVGWTQFWGAMFCYYVVANDFGFTPNELQFKANISLTMMPDANDIYNPSIASFGNSAAQAAIDANKCPSAENAPMVDWIYTKHAGLDLRVGALSCDDSSGTVVIS